MHEARTIAKALKGLQALTTAQQKAVPSSLGAHRGQHAGQTAAKALASAGELCRSSLTSSSTCYGCTDYENPSIVGEMERPRFLTRPQFLRLLSWNLGMSLSLQRGVTLGQESDTPESDLHDTSCKNPVISLRQISFNRIGKRRVQ